MITIFKGIISFLTNPKNTRMLLFAGIVLFALLFLRQCGKTSDAKAETEVAKQEIVRVTNNLAASKDTIDQYMVDINTTRAEIKGYELTVEELEGEYAELLADFEIEKNKPPVVIIKTVYVIKDSIIEVPIYVLPGDSMFDKYLAFSDSAVYDSIGVNYRFLTGRIPIIIDYEDSTLIPGFGTFGLELGMNLNLGLFKDKKTKEITILADTDYPGVTFTKLQGANILTDPKNKKILRGLRKSWGLGINVGYGMMLDIPNNAFVTGPYVGVGLSYTPKILQW
jgi:hypothetical protein